MESDTHHTITHWANASLLLTSLNPAACLRWERHASLSGRHACQSIALRRAGWPSRELCPELQHKPSSWSNRWLIWNGAWVVLCNYAMWSLAVIFANQALKNCKSKPETYLKAIFFERVKSSAPIALVIDETISGTIKHFSILKNRSPGYWMYMISRSVQWLPEFFKISPNIVPPVEEIAEAVLWVTSRLTSARSAYLWLQWLWRRLGDFRRECFGAAGSRVVAHDWHCGYWSTFLRLFSIFVNLNKNYCLLLLPRDSSRSVELQLLCLCPRAKRKEKSTEGKEKQRN